MHAFYLPPDAWREPFILEGMDAHHLSHVLRMAVGERVLLLDGAGREGEFRIAEIQRRQVLLEKLSELTHPRPASGVILAAGWGKAARRGWILEKAVELEAAGLWFWQAERSQFPVPKDIRQQWQAQLIAGAKQCHNPWLPELRTLSGGMEELVQSARDGRKRTSGAGISLGRSACQTGLDPLCRGAGRRTLLPGSGFSAACRLRGINYGAAGTALGKRCAHGIGAALVEPPKFIDLMCEIKASLQ